MADRITVKLTGFKDLKKNIVLLRKQEDNFRSSFKDLGSKVAEDMRADIDNKRLRPKTAKSKLTNAIDVEHKDGINNLSWGVGNIARLNKEVVGQDGKPYWLAVNFGSAHIVGLLLPKGGFTPGASRPDPASFREGRWKKGSANHHAIVKKPIPPMNYIQVAFDNMRSKFNRLLTRLRNKNG